MKLSISKILSVLILFTYLFQAACGGNDFETLPNEKCIAANNGVNTSGEFTSEGTCLYKHHLKTGKLDLIFVIDNSKSMYKDQQKLAQKFPQLIESIWSLDFKIAMMTTDIYKSPVKDGQFLTLSNGKKILSNSGNTTKEEVNSVFTSSITRSETLNCELSLNNCPSGDVRGIHAVNLAMTKNKSFFRPGAHIAIVLLSDADVRVYGNQYNYKPFALDPNWDTPESLVNHLSALDINKTLSFHSIIINPGDESLATHQQNTYELRKDVACYNQQNNEGSRVKGFYGKEYFKLSIPTQALSSQGNLKRGTVGSICDSDYSGSLGSISSNVKTHLRSVGLRCKNPVNIDAYYTSDFNHKISFELKGSLIELDQSVPIGSNITVEMECPNLH